MLGIVGRASPTGDLVGFQSCALDNWNIVGAEAHDVSQANKKVHVRILRNCQSLKLDVQK